MSRLPHAAPPAGTLRFEGRRIPFRAGDSVAAALHDAGILTYNRSRKFHRPRGLSGSFLAGHLAAVDGRPHVRLDREAAADGLDVRMENVWPCGGFDLLKLARVLPRRWLRAGFEHSNLVPSGTWLFEPWERVLRFMAGEADVPHGPHGGIVPGRRLEADVAVVGGGPAGCAAANEAARQGQSVVLVTRSATPGATTAAWGGDAPTLDGGITVMTGHVVCGVYDQGRHLIAAPMDGRLPATVIAAGRVVLANGRRSVPPLVPGAELPGVMDAGAALALAVGHAVAPGERTAVVGTGDEAALAQRLAEFGVDVVATLPVDRLRRIIGWNQVSGIEADGFISCDAVVHAGPWRNDRRLAFMASADGEMRLLAGDMPDNVTLAGGAAGPDEPVSHGCALHPSALVCPCMDVTADEILDLVGAGETHVEVLKRLTGCGMGPCQGVPCWDLLAHVVATATGQSPELIGHPSFRPPGAALTLAQAAGLADLVPLS